MTAMRMREGCVPSILWRFIFGLPGLAATVAGTSNQAAVLGTGSSNGIDIASKKEGLWGLRMHTNRGFTLIELMIVIAILGILLAIAIPAYNDYTIRSKVSEGMRLMTMAKSDLSESRQMRGIWPVNNADAGVSNTVSSTYVKTLVIASNVITVTLRNIDAQVNSKTFTLTGTMSSNNSAVQWVCLTGGGSPINPKFLPASCR